MVVVFIAPNISALPLEPNKQGALTGCTRTLMYNYE